MTSISLDTAALEQLHADQKSLLDTIDDLRKHGVGRFVDLPQIIVVGDQSSGKSSVLEAISRVRFPVKDGLCTRFATELVLRTDTRTKIDVQILPAVPTSKSQSFTETQFDKNELPRIIEDAKRTMLQGNTGFSEDVLRVEICGPDIPHLTLVDLPGFYHSEDENQSAAGRKMVDQLVSRYMARKNTIILAVVSARNQLILQKVHSKVNEHDPSRQRTITIVTKPDMLKPGSQEEKNYVREIRTSDAKRLALGWHVLRNRGENEEDISDEGRDKAETEFFQSEPWSSVPSKNCGIDMLRRRLSTLLLTHIKSNLRGIISEIENKIQERQVRLSELGEPRSGPKDLRAYLDKITSQYQILSRNALDGNYSHEFFGGLFPESSNNSPLQGRVPKLRALVRDLNRVFAYILETKGSTEIVLPRKAERNGAVDSDDGEDDDDEQEQHGEDDEEDEDDSEDINEDDEESCDGQKQTLPTYLQPLLAYYHVDEPRRVSFQRAANRLEVQSSANQGNEFPGTSNDRLAVEFFRHQCQPWKRIAREHMRITIGITQMFVEKLLAYVTGPDSKTYSTLLSEVVDPYFEKRWTLLENKMEELLHHYLHGHPQPLETEFITLLGRRNRKNMISEILRDLLKSQPEVFTKEGRTKLARNPSASRRSKFDAAGLINKAETYYQVSLRTFTENMIVLAIENCLIEEIPKILTTEMINNMDDEELDRLASESEDIRLERSEIKEEYDSLKRGLQSCNKYRERKTHFFTELDNERAVPVSTPAPVPSTSIPTPSTSTETANVIIGVPIQPAKTQKPTKPRSIFDVSSDRPALGGFASFSSTSNQLFPNTAAATDRPTKGSGGLFSFSSTPAPFESLSAAGNSSTSPAPLFGKPSVAIYLDLKPAKSQIGTHFHRERVPLLAYRMYAQNLGLEAWQVRGLRASNIFARRMAIKVSLRRSSD
ncbi:hypothetical protein JX266_002245 [Neoarthrinium moseri]|nr:hypothetical protein JX266_002245 [Neoarthrinium moseri]